MKRINERKRQSRRNDKALAKTAALLVLPQKGPGDLGGTGTTTRTTETRSVPGAARNGGDVRTSARTQGPPYGPVAARIRGRFWTPAPAVFLDPKRDQETIEGALPRAGLIGN